MSHSSTSSSEWITLAQSVSQKQKGENLILDGQNLDIGKIVAIARLEGADLPFDWNRSKTLGKVFKSTLTTKNSKHLSKA